MSVREQLIHASQNPLGLNSLPIIKAYGPCYPIIPDYYAQFRDTPNDEPIPFSPPEAAEAAPGRVLVDWTTVTEELLEEIRTTTTDIAWGQTPHRHTRNVDPATQLEAQQRRWEIAQTHGAAAGWLGIQYGFGEIDFRPYSNTHLYTALPDFERPKLLIAAMVGHTTESETYSTDHLQKLGYSSVETLDAAIQQRNNHKKPGDIDYPRPYEGGRAKRVTLIVRDGLL